MLSMLQIYTYPPISYNNFSLIESNNHTILNNFIGDKNLHDLNYLFKSHTLAKVTNVFHEVDDVLLPNQKKTKAKLSKGLPLSLSKKKFHHISGKAMDDTVRFQLRAGNQDPNGHKRLSSYHQGNRPYLPPQNIKYQRVINTSSLDNDLLSDLASPRPKRTTYTMDNIELPSCAQAMNRQEYWWQVEMNRKIYGEYNQLYHGKEYLHRNVSNLSLVQQKNITQYTNLSPHQKTIARGPWLQAFGLSKEASADETSNVSEFLDFIVCELFFKKYGVTLTPKQLTMPLSIDIYYRKSVNLENEAFLYIDHENCTLKSLLMGEPFQRLLSTSEAEKTNVEIRNVNIYGAARDNFLSYLEFVINGEPLDVKSYIGNLVLFFSASPDIHDAYVIMAKNRFMSALLQLIDKTDNDAIQEIIDEWMNGSIQEKLMGFVTSSGIFLIPGIIAITRPSGGVLVSLANSGIYFWTPDDTSKTLTNFIAKNLSVDRKKIFETTPLKTTLDIKRCIYIPTLVFPSSKDIWADLKVLHTEKFREHIGYHSIMQESTDIKESENVLREFLQSSSAAMALLAFFYTGGSSAGCSAMMMSNGLMGASTVLDVHNALTTQDTQRRKDAWQQALTGAFITGIAGDSDTYTAIKKAGKRGFQIINYTVQMLRDLIVTHLMPNGAETFFELSPPERAVMLVAKLVKTSPESLSNLGKNSLQAMMSILRISDSADGIYTNFLSEKQYIKKLFSKNIVLLDKGALKLIPPGYNLAIQDNEKKEITALLISLGEGEFAGFDLRVLGQSGGTFSLWGKVQSDMFNINNEGVLLTKGRAGSILIEDSYAADRSNLHTDILDLEAEVTTKFRRHCNKFKFMDDNDGMLYGIERFANNNGFNNVMYRALFIFDPALEIQTTRHYLVVGSYQNSRYILESNAEKLRFMKIPDIEDVTILSESKWSDIIKHSGSGALITFKDFPTLQLAIDYEHSFNLNDKNEKLLLSPPGFNSLIRQDVPITFSLLLSHYEGAEQQLILQKKIKKSFIKSQECQDNYKLILSVMRHAGVISQSHVALLTEAYRAHPQEAMLGIIRNPSQITTLADMLRTAPGKLVRFTHIINPEKSHIMISVGNGRFAAVNNFFFDKQFNSDKRILIAEQLGRFREDVLHSYNRKNTYLVEVGDIMYSAAANLPLPDVAEKICAKSHATISSTRFCLEILVTAHQLSPQQADALERLAGLMTGRLDGDVLSITKLQKFIAIESEVKNNNDLANLAAGKLIAFYSQDKQLYMMVCLGNDRFVGIDNRIINQHLQVGQHIISSHELGLINNGIRINEDLSFKAVIGEPNVAQTRVSALLGPDGRIDYVSHGLHNLHMEVKAHGAMASINHYDALELSDIISGLHQAQFSDRPLTHIELISCFGAFGGRRSSAQILSDRLGATVISYRGVVTDSKSSKRALGVRFTPLHKDGAERIRENERWHRRIHSFIEDVISLFAHLPLQRHGRAITETVPFAMVVIDIIHFLKKTINQQTLLRHYPRLMSALALEQAARLANPTGDEEGLIAALLTIFYGNDVITDAMDAYLLSGYSETEQPLGAILTSDELCHAMDWEFTLPPLKVFRSFPALQASRDLRPESNILVCLEDSNEFLIEKIIRVNSQCVGTQHWPLLLANFLRIHSEYIPVIAGIKDDESLKLSMDSPRFFFYLNSLFREDFSLSITLAKNKPRIEDSYSIDYRDFGEKGSRDAQIIKNIDYGHPMLMDQNGILTLRYDNDLSFQSHDNVTGSATHVSDITSLLSVPRIIIVVVENGERLTLLQRQIPNELFFSQEKLLFFIASEVNKYTSLIKVGQKNGTTIVPSLSITGNHVYSHPEALNESWIMINIVHND